MLEPSKFVILNREHQEAPSRVEIAAGQTFLDSASGTFVHVNGVGDLNITLAEVRSVRISNSHDEVARHEFVRCHSGVTHQVIFCDGGTVSMSFDLLGNLTSFVGSAVGISSVGCTLKVSQLSRSLRVPTLSASADL